MKFAIRFIIYYTVYTEHFIFIIITIKSFNEKAKIVKKVSDYSLEQSILLKYAERYALFYGLFNTSSKSVGETRCSGLLSYIKTSH